MNKKFVIKNNIDLANPILGTKIHSFSDEFFATIKTLNEKYKDHELLKIFTFCSYVPLSTYTIFDMPTFKGFSFYSE